jgi:hypothetical protein
MTPARAAEVLRSIIYRKSGHVRTACKMGADALELLSWLFDMDGNDIMRFHELERQWCQSGSLDSFLDYARAEWEKERRA